MQRFTSQHPSPTYGLPLNGVQDATKSHGVIPAALGHLDLGGR